MQKKRQKLIAAAFFAVYLFTVLWYTVINRSMTPRTAHFELFWSYRKWLAGDAKLGMEILANIAMFMPFGFFVSVLGGFRDPRRAKKRPAGGLFGIAGAAALLSLTIEVLQLVCMRGEFEPDDIFSNTVGAVCGDMLYSLLRGLPERGKKRNAARRSERLAAAVRKRSRASLAVQTAAVLSAVICGVVFASGGNRSAPEADISPRQFFFQAERAENDSGKLRLSGVAFRCETPEEELSLFLRASNGGRRVELKTEWYDRPGVNDHFGGSRDYLHSGFRAEADRVSPEKEYEIMVRWKGFAAFSTGVFLKGSEILYASGSGFEEPEASGTELEELLRGAALRVYRPDQHCRVYQRGNSLYWVVDRDGFTFEPDGTTYIQYQLYTTQTDRLPKKRLEKYYYWDNIGGYFEDYEIPGSFGNYRVMKRELPREYSVTAIVTGYYKNGEWVWKNCFRPVLELS